MDWFALVLGLLIGWALAMLLDYFFLKDRRICTDGERQLKVQVRELQGQNTSLEDRLRKSEENARRYKLSAATAATGALTGAAAATTVAATTVAADATTVSAAEGTVITEPDDLKKIWGIGPAVERHLNRSNIYTFAQLANTNIARLDEILEKAGSRFTLSNQKSWPDQARLAAEGKWDQLKRLQEKLDWEKGGDNAKA